MTEEPLSAEWTQLDAEVEVELEQVEEDDGHPMFPVSAPSEDIANINDHFTLPSKSSTVRFRSSVLRIFPDTNSNTQFVLESHTAPDGKEETHMKRMSDASHGLTALRASYTLVAVYHSGIILVYAISFLFNLITDIAIQSGRTSLQSFAPVTAFGVFLALPVIVYGLASALVFCGSFVSDTWAGSPMLKRYCFSNSSDVMFQWILFAAFLVIPVVVMCVCLMAINFDWWSITLMTWFSCVMFLYILYTFTIIYFETQACWNLTWSLGEGSQSFWQTCRACILLHQTSAYSGYKNIIYLAKGLPEIAGDNEREIVQKTYAEKKSLYTRLTLWSCLSDRFKLFQVLEKPRRLVSISEAQGARSFLSASTWNLEKVYCRPRRERLVTVIKGPDALTRPQVRSSLACACMGQILVMLVVASGLVYIGAGPAVVLTFVAIAFVFWIIPDSIRLIRLYQTFRGYSDSLTPTDRGFDVEQEHVAGELDDSAEQDDGQEGGGRRDPLAAPEGQESDAVYHVNETFRLTQPSPLFSWFMFSLEIALLFIWPLIALYRMGNIVIAISFTFMAIFACLRRFWNPATALQEVGTIKLACRKDDGKEWRRQARISSILDGVTVNRSRAHWMIMFSFVLVFFFVLCFLTIASDDHEDPKDYAFEKEAYLPDFEYVPDDELSYPTCTIGNNFLPGVAESQLVDYAFLAYMGYKDESVIQDQLDTWFGEDVATVMDDFVQLYRNATKTESRAVNYKLIQIEDGPSIVSIRGTFAIWDLFADAQLWMTAILMQILRAILPFGFMWTPIIDLLVAAISSLQSAALKRVSFYKDTTAFVEFLEQSNLTGGIMLTGHSLGGGTFLCFIIHDCVVIS